MPETLGSLRSRLTKLPHGASCDMDVLDGWVNDTVERICRSFPWTRLDQESVLEMTAEYLTGTVTIAAGATSGTGIGTAFTPSMTGRNIRFANTLPFYTFTYVSATSFTIDRAYEGTDNLVAGGFRIWQSIYTLPSNLERIKSLRSLTLGADLDEQSREWLGIVAPTRYEAGPPRVFVPAEDSSDGLQQIEVYPGPIVKEGLPMDWRMQPPLFDLTNADVDQVEFADWMSIPCVFAGVEANLYGLTGNMGGWQMCEQKYAMLLQQMMAEDARRMPIQQMREADRFTVHRRQRAARRYAGDIINWNPNN